MAGTTPAGMPRLPPRQKLAPEACRGGEGDVVEQRIEEHYRHLLRISCEGVRPLETVRTLSAGSIWHSR
jgi:hypothetical protein